MKKLLKISYTVADGVFFSEHFIATKKQAIKLILNRYKKYLIENMKIEEIKENNNNDNQRKNTRKI